MGGHARIYRMLTRLYPASFRRHYTEDLVQAFCDLVRRDGARSAWRRTAVDLLVTIPRYRLETSMNPRTSTLALQTTIGALVVAGLFSIVIGLYPGAGAVLVLVAVVVAVGQRHRLMASPRIADSRRRRRFLLASLALALVCVVSTTAFAIELNDDEHWDGLKLSVYNLVFFATLIGAIVCLVSGLRTAPSQRLPL